MKIIIKVLVMPGILTLFPSFTAPAQAAPLPRHRELTIWVDAPTGSHLGSGYASSYLTNIRARTLGKEDPKLRAAIDSLDGLGMLPVRGLGLVPAAVAWQTGTRMRTLIEQQADTGLSYGELLIANSLAAESKQSFPAVIALREKTRTWGELVEQLRVDPDLFVTRATTASRRIRHVEFKNRGRPDRAQNTSFSSINPHKQQSHLR